MASCWKLCCLVRKQQGKNPLCAINPIVKNHNFSHDHWGSKQSNCPDRFSPVSATTSTGSPRCSVSTCLSRSCLLGGKIQANSIEATNCCDSMLFTYVTSLNTTWHLWSLNRFQKWGGPGSLCPPIGALPSSQGCQASSLALHSIGMVWLEQHGLATPSDMQSLLLRPPSIGSCRSARCWPSCQRKTAHTVEGSSFESVKVWGNHRTTSAKNYIPWKEPTREKSSRKETNHSTCMIQYARTAFLFEI